MSGVDQAWLKRWCDTWRSALRLAQKEREVVYYTTGCKPRELQYVPVPKRQSASALPRNLKRLREEKGLTVFQLALVSGVSASYLRWLENAGNPAKILPAPGDMVNPGIVICLKLAQALGCGIQDLVEEREP